MLTRVNQVEAIFSLNNMASKVSKNKEVRDARWSLSQLKIFATVLADDQTNFEFTLGSLALKKSANLRVFESVKEEFDGRPSKQQKVGAEQSEKPVLF